MSEDAKVIVRRWFEEVWNKGRVEAIDELLADPCSVHGLGEEICCPGDFKDYHREMNAAIDNIEITLDKLASEGEEVFGVMNMKGVHKASGKGFTMKGAFIGTVSGGKLTYSRNIVDFMPMFIALGLMTEGSLGSVLAGGGL